LFAFAFAFAFDFASHLASSLLLLLSRTDLAIAR
jgi:hypothetical protein